MQYDVSKLIGVISPATSSKEAVRSRECEAKKYLAVNANKKMVQDKLAAVFGKVILLKDLTNLRAQMKSGKSSNDLVSVANTLSNKYGNLMYSVKINGVCIFLNFL